MAWTTPETAVSNTPLTASFWNQQVRDNMDFVAGAPFARNILYNGAMQIAQRGTSTASITTDGYYTADRWTLAIQTLGTWTQSIQADAPTGSGFRNSLKMLCTTAKASPAAGDYCFIRQLLEGQDLQRIAKGTSSAQSITVSFWVKSNLTGTFIAELQDNDNNRTISQSYTISASATWEKKTLTFAADTTGAFDNDNAASLALNFWLASGTTYTSGTLQTTWATRTDANRNVGGTNLAATTNNYWQVTGVQLEVGSAATGFEFLPYGDELRRCQRYTSNLASQLSNNSDVIVHGACVSTTAAFLAATLPVEMRSTPTINPVTASYFSLGYWTGANIVCTGVGLNGTGSTPRLAFFYVTVASGLTANYPIVLYRTNLSGNLILSAEL